MKMAAELSIDERRARLQNEIGKYIKKGFRVLSQTDTTAQLVKPKKFSFLWAIFWFLFLFVGLLVYLIYYLSKHDETIYIEVSSSGKITTRK
jgi:hypothetical protein